MKKEKTVEELKAEIKAIEKQEKAEKKELKRLISKYPDYAEKLTENQNIVLAVEDSNELKELRKFKEEFHKTAEKYNKTDEELMKYINTERQINYAKK